MTTRAYTLLGRFVWQVLSRELKREMRDNRVKIGAAATVVAVLAAGVLAARASSSDS
jgi:hypothetical protein